MAFSKRSIWQLRDRPTQRDRVLGLAGEIFCDKDYPERLYVYSPNYNWYIPLQPESRTATEIGGTPTARDISLRELVTLYLDTSPAQLYRVSADGATFTQIGTGAGGSGSSTLLGAWDPANNVPTLSSGNAPSLGQPTNYIVTASGITSLGVAIDGITAVRQNDIISWTPALGVWTRLAGPRIAPITQSGGTLTLTDAHATLKIICTGTPTIKLPAGLPGGFGCAIKGAFTFDGTGLTIGSGITDQRTATGLANQTCVIDATGTDTYDLLGSKT